MKRIFTLLFLLPILVWAQDNINHTDNKGQKQGLWKTFYHNGKLLQEAHYEDGKLHGILRSYDNQGAITGESEFEAGIKHGISKSFYYTGQVQSIIRYHYGQPWSAIATYNFYGRSLPPGTLNNGNGALNHFDESGNLLYSEDYEEGRLVSLRL